MNRWLAATVFLVSAATGVSAQLPFQHHPSKDPYRSLFTDGSAPPRAPQPPRRLPQPLAAPDEARRPMIVCGTMIVPADPAVDAKMAIRPSEPGVEHTIRAVAPPICNPDDPSTRR